MTMTKNKNNESFFGLTHTYSIPAFHFFDNTDLHLITEAKIVNSKTFLYINLIFQHFDKILLLLSSNIISNYVFPTQFIILWKSLFHISLDYCHGIRLL